MCNRAASPGRHSSPVTPQACADGLQWADPLGPRLGVPLDRLREAQRFRAPFGLQHALVLAAGAGVGRRLGIGRIASVRGRYGRRTE